MQLRHSILLLTLYSSTLALPSLHRRLDFGPSVGNVIPAGFPSTGKVCNCQNMSGAEDIQNDLGANSCTLFLDPNTGSAFCVFDQNHQLFYQCPLNGNSVNCNACAQSADGPNDSPECPQPNQPS